jgi:hypothetical protein
MGTLVGVVVVLAWIGVTAASADTRVIASRPASPWSDPNHETPLERLASGIASTIAKRPVRVQCNAPDVWDAHARADGFDAGEVWGFVSSPGLYAGLGFWTESATHAELSPLSCERLSRFASAATKPTKCALVSTAAQSSQRRPLRFVPCFGGTRAGTRIAAPRGGWQRYAEHVVALQTLAHEAVHLRSFTAGNPVVSLAEEESRAECVGMQLTPVVATSLGASPNDARAMARWYWKTVYPTHKTANTEYWSPECRPGGALDETPGDRLWP